MSRGVKAAAVGATAAVATSWTRRRRAARSKWSPARGTEQDAGLAVRVLGEGPPRIVLLHGMFNSGRYWGGSFDVLAGDGKLVVPDLLGFGRSPRPATGYSPDAHADAVADTLRSLGAAEPVVIGAHSLGTLIAMRVAVRHPNLVGGIVAISPPLYRDAATAERRLASSDPLARVLFRNERLGRSLCGWMCRFPHISAALLQIAVPSLPPALAKDRVQHSWASYSETLTSVIIGSDAPKWLDDLTLPTVVVYGTEDDVLDIDFLEDLSGLHENLRTRSVTGGGHDLPLSRTSECLGEIQSMASALAAKQRDAAAHPGSGE